MNNFIFKASTMRERTEFALSNMGLKKKINDAIETAADNGEYWCQVTMPSLIKEEVVDSLVADLIESGHKVKVTSWPKWCLTIQWAPDGAKVVFDGEEWK